MKFFTATALLAAAIAGVVISIPFMPAAKEDANLFDLEVRLMTRATGRVQVYYDAGSGFDESNSSQASLKSDARPATYDLPLPPGSYQRLRLDPIDGDGIVTLESVRVVSASGRTLREIPLSRLAAINDIRAMHAAPGRLEIVPTPRHDDPQLLITFDPPLRLARTWALLAKSWWRPALVFAALAVILLALDRLPALRRSMAAGFRRFQSRPRAAVWTVAAIAVVASSYPVVFLGKSFVSPNMGTVLLYDDFPTLPGSKDRTTTDVKGSDIGAIMWQHVPLSVVEARALRHGELPLWNRYNSCGAPLLGQGQSMFGDPLHFLVLVANGASWAWDLKYLIAKCLFAAGLGFIVLATLEGSPVGARPGAVQGARTASLIVAAAAPFVGFFIYRVNHPAYFSMCYAPWPLYCWVRLAGARKLRATAGWTGGLMFANLALMNSGTAKEAYVLLVAMNFAGACVLAAADSPWRSRLGKFAIACWAGILFALITAPVWLTFLHELHDSYTSYNIARAYQIQPTLLIGLFDEIFYRPLMPAQRTFDPALNFLLLPGFLYFTATLRQHFQNRAITALAVASLAPLSLAFGLVPPSWIVRVPILANVVHIDNTFSCALVVLWCVLAGAGFASAASRLKTPEGSRDLVVAGLLLLALVFGWIAFRQVVHRPIYGTAFTVNELGRPLPVAPFIWGYLASLLIALVVLSVAVRRALARGNATAGTVILIAVAAITLCWRNGLQAPGVGFESYVIRPTSRVNFGARSEAVRFIQSATARDPSRVYGIRGNLMPGWNDEYGLETVHGPDALMNPDYRALTNSMDGIKRMWDWRLYLDPNRLADAHRFLDTLNVRYYVDYHSDQGLMGRSLEVAKLADLDVYESPTAWPRAFFTDQVLRFDHLAQYIDEIRKGDGRPFAAILKPDLAGRDTIAALWGDWKKRTIIPAAHYRLTGNSTSFDVHATAPGVVMLDEAWWPGDFRATLNGRSAPVVRLNYAFKGVAVPGPGEYHVVFRYVPEGWYRDLSLCALGWLLLAGSVALVIRIGMRVHELEGAGMESAAIP